MTASKHGLVKDFLADKADFNKNLHIATLVQFKTAHLEFLSKSKNPLNNMIWEHLIHKSTFFSREFPTNTNQ